MTFSADCPHTDYPRPHFQSDVSEEQWQAIHSLLPTASRLGAPRQVELRAIVNGIRYARKTGCQWRALPTAFGNWNTVYGYYREWNRTGVWRRVQEALSEGAPTPALESSDRTAPPLPRGLTDTAAMMTSTTEP